MGKVGLRDVANVRDLGSITCRGGTLLPKALLRGGSLHRLTGRDVAVLRDDYRPKLVIDLRTDTEREEKPDVAILGAEYASIPIFDEAAVGITRERTLRRELASGLTLVSG